MAHNPLHTLDWKGGRWRPETMRLWFGKNRASLTDAACFLAIFLLPWQGRWIFTYYELAGQRYEYGAFSLYAGSIVLVAAAALFYRRTPSHRAMRLPTQLLLGWLAINWLFSFDRVVGLYYLYLGILSFGFFFIASRWGREKIATALIVSGIFQAIFAWTQFINQRIDANTWLGIAGHLPQELGQSVVYIYGARYLRAYGLLPHPNMLGGFLVVVFALLLYRFIRFRNSPEPLQTTAGWTFYVAGLLFVMSGILITFSRAALIAAALLLVLWTYAYLMRKKSFFRAVFETSLLCLSLFVIYNLMTSNVWLARLGLTKHGSAESIRLEQVSTEERIAALHEAQVLARPRAILMGVGLGNYLPKIAQAFPSLQSYAYQPAHNVYVLMIIEIGAIGGFLLTWFIFDLLKKSWREGRNGATIYFFSILASLAFVGLFDHFLWTSYFGQSLWWLVVGIATNKR